MSMAALKGLHSPQEQAAAARSRLYAQMAAGFSYPSHEAVEGISRGEFAASLQREIAALPFALSLPEEMVAALATLSIGPAEFEAEFIRLFEVGAGKPPCPLYEGIVRGTRLKLLEDLVRFYEHFGLRGKAGDLPDHLACELEFMHYLSFKEVAALQGGQDAGPYLRAQRDFLARHLCRWLPRLHRCLEAAGAAPFFRALIYLTEEFCRHDLLYLQERVRENPTSN
jgi:DMSO reductase family type II enzyme chaperone